jgi:hypothetical protein
MPRWTLSHIAQSWRLTRSQKSAASEGSKPGRASSSGWNSSSHTTVVSAGPCGHRVKAATWTVDRLSIRLGLRCSVLCEYP